jgi:hypothetical protein
MRGSASVAAKDQRWGPWPGRAAFVLEVVWRPGPESNRGKRICNPARNHSATGPSGVNAESVGEEDGSIQDWRVSRNSLMATIVYCPQIRLQTLVLA